MDYQKRNINLVGDMGLLVADCMEADLNASLMSSVRKVLDLSYKQTKN